MASPNSQTTFGEFPISQSIGASFGGPQGGYTPGSSTMYLKGRRTPSKLIIVLTYEVWQFIWDFFDLSNVYKERTVYVGGIKNTHCTNTKRKYGKALQATGKEQVKKKFQPNILVSLRHICLMASSKVGLRDGKINPHRLRTFLTEEVLVLEVFQYAG